MYLLSCSHSEKKVLEKHQKTWNLILPLAFTNMWFWINYLISLSLIFSFYKVRMKCLPRRGETCTFKGKSTLQWEDYEHFLHTVEPHFFSVSQELPTYDWATLTSILVGEVLSKCSKSAIPKCCNSQVCFCSTTSRNIQGAPEWLSR